ncbi:hypothetical protein C5167_033430 [Papaver somniferum]|uniref:Uncharacterized protein n=1 Tax=Papaver somniferum TaxID=3469 RepID=A0A4Y7KB18_PAPSO|nr:hypothetical protein C5167_033430 [Papaver somniferum]
MMMVVLIVLVDSNSWEGVDVESQSAVSSSRFLCSTLGLLGHVRVRHWPMYLPCFVQLRPSMQQMETERYVSYVKPQLRSYRSLHHQELSKGMYKVTPN